MASIRPTPSIAAGPKPRVLVVEDEDDLRRMLTYLLGQIGDVSTAVDGADAIEKMQQGLIPDVIVTDLMMPRMDGLALAKALKDMPEHAKIPLVMLTAKSAARDVIGGINAGARHYVTKPFKADDLLDKVRKALKK